MKIAYKEIMHCRERENTLQKPLRVPASIVLAHSDLAGKLLDCSAVLPESVKNSRLIQDYLDLSQSDFAELLSDLGSEGDSLELLMGCSPDGEQGKPARKVAVFREAARLTWVIAVQDNCQISRGELARERDKLRMILDYAPIGIWSQDGNGKLEFVNKAFCLGMGISEEKFLSVDHYQEVIPEEFRPICLASDAKALASDSPTVTIQQLPFSDGLVHDLWVIKAVKRNDDGSPRSLVGLALDITDRLRHEAALRDVHHQLQQLTIKNEQRRIKEHRIIAQTLHDDLGQLLTAISLGLETLTKLHLGDAQMVGHLGNLQEIIGEAIQTTRDVSATLRPPAYLEQGLAFAVHKLIARLNDSSPTLIATDIDDPSFPSTLDGEQIILTFYRLIQEGLTNALRHAAAKTIRIKIWQEDGATKAQLSDNGKGFVSSDLKYSKGLGLLSLRERAEMLGGRFLIESTVGHGTRLLMTIPTPAGDGAEA